MQYKMYSEIIRGKEYKFQKKDALKKKINF